MPKFFVTLSRRREFQTLETASEIVQCFKSDMARHLHTANIISNPQRFHMEPMRKSLNLIRSGVVKGWGDGAVALNGTSQKGGTLMCQKIGGSSFSVQQYKKGTKKLFTLIFLLCHS